MQLKNKLIKLLLSFFSPRKPSGVQHFLIVSTTGLGDTLWATPAIRALRHCYPDAYLALLTTPLGFDVLHNNPHIDEFYIWKKPHLFSFFSLLFSLRKKNIEKIFIFHASQRAIFPLCALIQAPEIIGTEGINKGLDFILTKRTSYKPMHEIARRLEIIGEVEARMAGPFLEFYISKEGKEKADHFLEKFKIPPFIPLVGIHPGAKDKFKQWDPASFVLLAKRLQDHLGCQIFITGNQDEKDLVSEIAAQIPGAIAITEKLALPTFAALISKFSLMISNDTGPMHLAFALRTPIVALFGPTDPRLCGPFAASHNIVIAQPPTCTPCLRKKCQAPFCLLQISPEMVYEAALQLYYSKRPSTN